MYVKLLSQFESFDAALLWPGLASKILKFKFATHALIR